MYSQGISGIVILINICASIVQTTAKREKCCVSLHTTQHEKALALRDLFTQLRLAATSSDTFESTRNIQLGKCTVDLTRSDPAKQDYLQQELIKEKHFCSSSTGAVSKGSGLSVLGTLATQMTFLVCPLLSCSSRPGPGHKAMVLLSERSRNSLKIHCAWVLHWIVPSTQKSGQDIWPLCCTENKISFDPY